MEGREGMASFYLNRGLSGSGTNAGSDPPGGIFRQPPPGFKTPSNPSSMRAASFQMEHNPSPPGFPHSLNMAGAGAGHAVGGGGSSGGAVAIAGPASGAESVVKKKRGRPRKYTPDGSHMALGLTPASPVGSPEMSTPPEKKKRGRPRGSGRKQRLADVGEWMHSSAGSAFTPHIIQISEGEDVAEKVMSFAQQRPRALCVLSANGTVSVVSLRQFTSSGGTVTYEGRFEILNLSGSYLLGESGGPRNRTGGLSISVCSADGQVIGGAIGGKLIASTLVQVVVCSFIYGGGDNSKAKTAVEPPSGDDKSPGVQLN